MAVPEAAVYKNSCTVFAEYYIGSTREILYIQAVSESVSKQETPYKKFRNGVLATDALHAFVALLGIEFVWHS